MILYWKYMSSISRFIIYLYCWIYRSYILHKKLNKILQEHDRSFVPFWNLKSLFYLLSFVFIRFTTRCHSLLLFTVTRCHSLSLAAVRRTTRFLSLSLVTRCTTRLSFCKNNPKHTVSKSWKFWRSLQHWNNSLPWDRSLKP